MMKYTFVFLARLRGQALRSGFAVGLRNQAGLRSQAGLQSQASQPGFVAGLYSKAWPFCVALQND